MSDQVVTNADSTAAAGTEAPAPAEAPANDPSSETTSQATTSQEQAPFQLDEDVIKKYESTQAFQEKYVPKAVFTQKTQALAEDRKRMEAERAAIFELARKALSEKQAPGGPTAEETRLKELRDLAAAGDPQALEALAEAKAEAKIQPIRTQVALQSAAQSARAASPYVVEHWNEIIQTMQNDPVIAQMATMNNYAAADKVMIALGLEHQVKDLVPKYQQAQEKIKALEAKLQQYEKERVAGLPSSTARAGTTSGRPAAGDAKSVHEAGLKAWIEMGFPPESYR
jgi:hypothetical protein